MADLFSLFLQSREYEEYCIWLGRPDLFRTLGGGGGGGGGGGEGVNLVEGEAGSPGRSVSPVWGGGSSPSLLSSSPSRYFFFFFNFYIFIFF